MAKKKKKKYVRAPSAIRAIAGYRAVVKLEKSGGKWTAAIAEFDSKDAFEAQYPEVSARSVVVECGHLHEADSMRMDKCLIKLGMDSRVVCDFHEHARKCKFRQQCDCGMGHLCEHEKGCDVCDKNECPTWKEMV